MMRRVWWRFGWEVSRGGMGGGELGLDSTLLRPEDDLLTDDLMVFGRWHLGKRRRKRRSGERGIGRG